MLLNGKELSGFIKERQAKQVRRLQAQGVRPKLAIVLANNDAPSLTYTKLKQSYGHDIGVAVDIHQVEPAAVESLIKKLNADGSVGGIIVQLPLLQSLDTQATLDLVDPVKDVDGLGTRTKYTPATPTSILWLLAGYNIDLKAKKIAILGRGKLVGEPLYRILKNSHQEVEAYDKSTTDLAAKIKSADIIITATGQAKLIKSANIKPGVVIIDASTAAENGKLVGDVDPALYKRDDIKVSPVPGGVGPLTVCALFENLIAGPPKD